MKLLKEYQKHPFPMKGIFKKCFLVNYTMEPEVLAAHLPKPIKPEIYKGKAHLSIVIAELEHMRPVFFPHYNRSGCLSSQEWNQ